MTPTPCPKCGTMLTRLLDGARLDYRGNLFHDPAACLEVQLTADRAKVEEATEALKTIAAGIKSRTRDYANLFEVTRAALEKLRGLP